MTPEPESDLHWTAFLYVSGELSAGEASAFEHRLDEDQRAREAVASAVELAGALALLGVERGPRWPSRRARAIAIALAAAFLLAAALGTLRTGGRPASPDASEVAEAWSGLRASTGGESEAEWMVRAPASDAPDASDDLDAPAERALPSWLLSATSANRDESHREEN